MPAEPWPIMAVAAGAVLAALALLTIWLRRPWPAHAGAPAVVAAAATDGSLARLLGPLLAAHAGHNGVRLLGDPTQALAVRLALIARASQSIDAQYYIISDDDAGHVFLDALDQAAARGVAVRLLVDDMGTEKLDSRLLALAAQPSCEVRLINPLRLRRLRMLNLLLNFAQLNRRMHNKSLSIDGLAAIVGGRNIGCVYFDTENPGLMADQDVLAVGPIVADVEDQFVRYWNAAIARPIGEVVRARPHHRPHHRPRAISQRMRDWQAVAASPETRALMDDTGDFVWAKAQLFSDPPAKLLGTASTSTLVLPGLLDVVAPITSRVQLVSAYFVPPAKQVAAFAELAARGVAVDVLTNSLISNDVVLAHVWYAPWRLPLLRAGVRLWEMRGSENARAKMGLVPRRLRRGSGGTAGPSFFRSGGSALHAKMFVVDGRWLFVGSMNFDERSLRLNSEMGFLIDAPALAANVSTGLDAWLPHNAWGLSEQDGALAWHEGDRVLQPEPGTNAVQRLAMRLLARLPLARNF